MTARAPGEQPGVALRGRRCGGRISATRSRQGLYRPSSSGIMRPATHAYRLMNFLLDILQGAGLGAATGLRPFLPALAAGALARGDVGVDFEGTSFAFLESPVWLLALVLALGGARAARAAHRRARPAGRRAR